jgi:hypothetical protein
MDAGTQGLGAIRSCFSLRLGVSARVNLACGRRPNDARTRTAKPEKAPDVAPFLGGKHEYRNPKQAQMTKTQNPKRSFRRAIAFRSFEFRAFEFRASDLFRISNFGFSKRASPLFSCLPRPIS